MGRTFPSPPGRRSRPVDTEVADLVTQVARHLRRSSRGALAPLGVTWGQVRALRALDADEPVRMSVLAERLGVARRSATSVVDELVDRGLVRRGDDPHDRRAVVVAPTPKGVRLLARLEDVRAAAARDLVADLSADERATLADLLGRLVPNRADES